MRSTFKELLYVNGSKEKNGIVPIMERVTINGSAAQFSCKRTIAKELWDVKGKNHKLNDNDMAHMQTLESEIPSIQYQTNASGVPKADT